VYLLSSGFTGPLLNLAGFRRVLKNPASCGRMV
jgi:hypothetical protein